VLVETTSPIKHPTKLRAHTQRAFSTSTRQGWFTPHPFEVIPGGLDGVEKGLSNLMNGVNSATKYVFKIEDTRALKL
jgi:hypothetical protein